MASPLPLLLLTSPRDRNAPDFFFFCSRKNISDVSIRLDDFLPTPHPTGIYFPVLRYGLRHDAFSVGAPPWPRIGMWRARKCLAVLPQRLQRLTLYSLRSSILLEFILGRARPPSVTGLLLSRPGFAAQCVRAPVFTVRASSECCLLTYEEGKTNRRNGTKALVFPLYPRGERFHFEYGVYLLNKNIAQV
ncbi:hypothetical protein EYF80_012778 [Liparis tanakae]|uniref:Uncharacterized protein n=1 Tax=Liparis tanakae TaxID=230148 RepID=A0A4Z2IHY1_9TELE|nr:hypothetical protein EYF80_012778 [Liparis tanakae]